MAGDSGLKMPETPVIVAGALGGPFCMYFVTPWRNAMSYASQDASATLGSLGRIVFSKGPLSGWQGGVYPAIAACPQYLCLGPMYKFFESFAGNLGGIVLTGATETAVLYGAETKNGQIAINAAKGHIPEARIQSVFNPWGPGTLINFARNVFAMSGMRVINEPIADAVSKAAGGKGPVVTLASDLVANCCAAGITMPMHMLYQFVITSGPELWDKPQAEQNQAMTKFLKDAYFPNGRLSSVILRDLVLRSGYIATAYTMYMQIERAAIKHWPK
jgi:hypothetical protein